MKLPSVEFTSRFMKGLQFAMLFLTASLLHAQSRPEDDPNLDQLPYKLREETRQDRPAPASYVITVENWDNFSMGTDLGENNIAASLQEPAKHFVAYNINAGHYTNNGAEWEDVIPDFGTTLAGDPVVAYDSLGNLFYVNLFPKDAIEGVKVIRSTDNGASWSPSVTGTYGNDKCWVACDQTNGPYANNVYVCMTNYSQGAFARSTDHGASFETTFSPATQTLPGMMVCVGPQGNVQGGAVYCVTNSGNSFNSVYTFYRSLDGGATFQEMSSRQFANTVGTQVGSRHSVQGMRTRPYPYIAADNSYGPYRGRLYLVYASNDPPGDGYKPDIWLRYSDDGGMSFSESVRVNDDLNTAEHFQWHPAIWCDKQTGRLYINWMDTRDTPTGDSAYMYVTFTDDGGMTYASNQKLSNEKMKIDCPTCPGSGTPRYQGDYNGIVSNSRSSLSGWTDFRNGNFMSTAGYFPDFAMAIDHSNDTLYAGNDSIDFIVSIPQVKMYSDTVVLSAVLSPPAGGGGSVSITFPQGNTITTYPDSRIIRLKSSGGIETQPHELIITAAGPNGTPVHKRTASVELINTWYILLDVTAAPSDVCPGASAQLMANASGGNPPYTYLWSSRPPGFNSTSANPVVTPLTDTWYKVTVTDTSSHVSTDSVRVTILSVPEMPGPINGPSTICKGGLETFFIQPVFGATSYSWMVPPDALILNGQNTPVVQVLWGDNEGTISVISGNYCGNSNPSVLSVTTTDVPPVPGDISGPSAACPGASVQFIVDEVPGTIAYLWSVYPDGIIRNGQGTDVVTVEWGEQPGTITVLASNNCGNGLPKEKQVGIESPPFPAGPITGKDSVCLNHSYEFSVGEIQGATSYVWSVPAGSAIIGNQTGNNVLVDFSPEAISGEVTVSGKNTCGPGESSSKAVLAYPCPGIDKKNVSHSISLFPNPVSDALNISFPENLQQTIVQLSSVSGRIVWEKHYGSIQAGFTEKINVSDIAGGIFILKVISGQQVMTAKVVLKKE